MLVAPFAGAWIEILTPTHGSAEDNVAPFAGAWIEIGRNSLWSTFSILVAPFAGAWIEIKMLSESGIAASVAPFAGAWIEISTETALSLKLAGRSLYLAF